MYTHRYIVCHGVGAVGAVLRGEVLATRLCNTIVGYNIIMYNSNKVICSNTTYKVIIHILQGEVPADQGALPLHRVRGPYYLI